MAKGEGACGRGPVFAILAAAVFVTVIGPASAQDVTSGTAIYGTGQSATNWAGGTIFADATLRLDDGGTVSGNASTNGTLQFNQTGALTISSTISGAGTLALTNTGTLNLTGTTSAANTVVLDMTTSAAAGLLQIRSGTGQLFIGTTGTGSLNVAGGNVTNGFGHIGASAGSVGSATVSSGTWTNTNLAVGSSGTGTLDVTGGSVTNSPAYIGNASGGVGTATISGGT